MGLLFTINGSQRVAVGNSTAIISNICTILAWVYPTDVTTGVSHSILERTPSDFSDYRGLQIATSGISAFMRRGSPAYTGIEIGASGFMVANQWQFVGCQMDASGTVAANQKLFYGTLLAAAAEVSSYDTQDPGSGATSQGSSENTTIGNNNGSSYGSGFPGKIAWVGTWSRILTVGEIIAQQFRPHRTANCELLMHLFGTGTQPDLSGNGRNGTVTGATADSHVPLGRFY